MTCRRGLGGWMGVAALSLLVGCDFAIDSDLPLVENRCSSDDDCPGASCELATAMCIAAPSEAYQVGFEVTPTTDPIGGSPVPRVLGPFPVTGPMDLDLDLPAPISVIGNVRLESSSLPVQADLRFIRMGTFAGSAPSEAVTETVSEPVEAADGMLADYAVRVIAEREYEIVVEPTGDSAQKLPPLRTRQQIPGGGDFVRIDITYPEEGRKLRGVLVDSADTPVDGLQVRAVHAATGQLVSSTATSGEDERPGAFELVIDPSTTEWLIRISGGSERPVFPTLQADPAYLWPEQDGEARILVPMMPQVRYVGSVGRQADATGRVSVPEAVVTFRSEDLFDSVTGLSGSFRTTVTASANAEFEVALFPGTYEVLVTPPPDQPSVGVHTRTIRIKGPSEGNAVIGQRFELPVRTQLEGEVRTDDGRFMPRAQVQADALGLEPPTGADPAARYNRSNETTTDEAGRFRLPLDIGSYDVSVKPPSESGFSWTVAPAVALGQSGNAVPETFPLSAPVPLDGLVWENRVDELASAGAEIRAFAILDPDGESPRTISIGRATADDEGRYRILLPERLGR